LIRLNVDASVTDSRRTWTLTLLGKAGDRSCWFAVDETIPEPPTFDFALAASVHRAMADGEDLHLAGTASFAMLANLEHYIEIWSSWRPDLYQPIGLSADKVDTTTSPHSRVSPSAVLAFSGGLDSSATLVRQIEGLAKRDTAHVRMLMVVHGFDLPLDAPSAFSRALTSIGRQVARFELPSSVVTTNWRQTFQCNWEMEYVAALSACLHLYSAQYPVGLFAIDESYATIKDYLPWSNNPVSNHYLSGESFEVRGDAGALSRGEKAELVARYPEIGDNLRVCWAGPMTGENCGRCEKCVRTQLNFIARGLLTGSAFPRELIPEDVIQIAPKNATQLMFMEEICREADLGGCNDQRIEALRGVVRDARRRDFNSGESSHMATACQREANEDRVSPKTKTVQLTKSSGLTALSKILRKMFPKAAFISLEKRKTTSRL